MAYKLTKEDVLEAIKDSGALITTIQKRLSPKAGKNISWHCAKKYTEQWEETKEAMEAERQTVLDVAEGTIMQEIYQKNVEVAKWYLKQKGRDRGYEETAQINLNQAEPLNINLSGDTMTAEELLKSDNVEITGVDTK